MTGGGLIALSRYGAQNVVLSGNPQLTYFYKVFKRYTHFSLETITQQMDGINSFSYDSAISLNMKIPRSGDLLTDCVFSFDLPDIYSKYIDLKLSQRKSQYEFQWTRFVGCAAIQTVGIYVGGRLIQEFTGEYLLAQALMDYDVDTFEKWRIMVGDTPDLTDPANSVYAGGLQHFGYPTVVPDYITPGQFRSPQLNAPSIRGKTIYVPLPFWFCKEFSQGLPLVALQLHVVEIKITLNPLRQLYTLLDENGFRCAPGYHQLAPASQIQINQPEYGATSDPSSQIRYFLTDINYSIPELNSFSINPTLHMTYAFLPESEQTLFATQPLSYPIRQYSLFPFTNTTGRSIVQIEIHNPITRMVFLNRRTDSLPYKNDFYNFTNWWNSQYSPFTPPGNQIPLLQNTNSSGQLVPQTQPEIIRSLRVIADGNEIQEAKPGNYFSDVVPWRYLKGQPRTEIPVFTFELHSPTYQPAGSLNASVIAKLQVDLDVYPLPSNSPYLYSINIYVETLNWFLLEGGMGDLKYSL